MQKFARMEDVGPSGSTDDGLQRGPWAEWEDELLAKYVAKYGEGNWASVKEKLDIGLKRCGKSCRLRYLNHLKPGLKKGAFRCVCTLTDGAARNHLVKTPPCLGSSSSPFGLWHYASIVKSTMQVCLSRWDRLVALLWMRHYWHVCICPSWTASALL
jgi:hypothetical protein